MPVSKKSRHRRGERTANDQEHVTEVIAVPVVSIAVPTTADVADPPIAVATLAPDTPFRPDTPPYPSPTSLRDSETPPALRSPVAIADASTANPATATETIHHENLVTVARNVCCGLGCNDTATTFFTCKKCGSTVGETLCVCGEPLHSLTHFSNDGHQFLQSVVFEPNSRRNVCNRSGCASDGSSAARAFFAINADNLRVARSILRFAVEGVKENIDDRCFPLSYLMKNPKRRATTASAAQGYAVLGCNPPLVASAIKYAPDEEEVRQFIEDDCHIPKGSLGRPSSKWKRSHPSLYVLLALFARMLKVLPLKCAIKAKTSADAEGVWRIVLLLGGAADNDGAAAAAATAPSQSRKRKSTARAPSPNQKTGIAGFGGSMDHVAREVAVLFTFARVSAGFAQLTSKSQAVTRELHHLAALFPDLEPAGVINMMMDYFSVALAVHIGSSGALAAHADDAAGNDDAGAKDVLPTPLSVLLSVFKTQVTMLTRYVANVNTAASGTTGASCFVVPSTLGECRKLTAAAVEQMPEFGDFCKKNKNLAIVSVFPSDAVGQPILYVLNPSVPRPVVEVVKRANKLLGEVIVLKSVILQLLTQPDDQPDDQPDNQTGAAAFQDNSSATDMLLSLSRSATPMKTPTISRFVSPSGSPSRTGVCVDNDDFDDDDFDDDNQQLPAMTPVATDSWEDTEWV